MKDFLTLLGFVVSIGLGLWNLRATKRIRSATITIEELRSQVRDPIHKKLDALLEARNSFATLAKPNGFKIDELRAKVSDIVSQVEFLLLDLSTLLEQADGSKFTADSDWVTSFAGCIDAVTTEANKLAAPKASLVDLGAGIGVINIRVEALNKDLRARLEKELRKHLPS